MIGRRDGVSIARASSGKIVISVQRGEAEIKSCSGRHSKSRELLGALLRLYQRLSYRWRGIRRSGRAWAFAGAVVKRKCDQSHHASPVAGPASRGWRRSKEDEWNSRQAIGRRQWPAQHGGQKKRWKQLGVGGDSRHFAG